MEEIIRYFIEEKGVTEAVAKVLARPLTKYEDIREEFLYWLRHRTYDKEAPLSVQGYTAEQIHEIAPFLDAAGVYNFMVTLREDPEKAQGYIQNGFPRK